MRAGKLRHRITIQQLTAGSPQQTPEGEPDEAWVDYLTVSASIEPLRGRELIAAQQINSEIEGKIRMRYRDGIVAKMRAVYAGVNYDIVAVTNPDMRNIELELWFKTGVNNG